MCIVWGGAYHYIEKSSSYCLEDTYILDKKNRALLKLMSIVFPDGYVLDTIGPYFADGKNNDRGYYSAHFTFKATKSAAMNIFRFFFYFLF